MEIYKKCKGTGIKQIKDESNRIFARIITCRACNGTGFVENKKEKE